METMVTVFMKYGDLACAKRCCLDYSREELVHFACSRWADLTRDNIALAYHLRGPGELSLHDEEDMATMMALMMDRQLHSINVVVSRIDNQFGDGHRNGISQHEIDVVEFGSQELVQFDSNQPELGVQSGPRLRSEEWRELINGVGQRFCGGAVEFRKALAMYSMQMDFQYKLLRNDQKKVTAECKLKPENGCQWRIHASEDASDKAFYIRKYDRTHSCSMLGSTSRGNMISASIIVDLVADDIRAMPSMTPVQVRSMVKKNYGLDITYTLAWKATDTSRSLIFGDHSKSFSLLKPYIEEADRTNPRSYFDLDIDDENRFRRCFFAFAASLDGFKHCRPMLMVDGTFLKGKHKGILLSAVGKDRNEGIFPIAFAVVSEETDDNREYFLKHLKTALKDLREIVFISDRNHGILEGVRSVFPESPHAFCYVHLKANLKDKFRGYRKIVRKTILKHFGKCAYAPTKPEFEKWVQNFKNVGVDKAISFLEETPKERWANAYFQGKRYGHMTSNACESWNSQIRDVRMLPVTSLIDGIRLILMKQMCNRRQMASTWTGKLSKNIESKMIELKEQARGWDIGMSIDSIFEVFSTPRAVVDTKQHTCTCKLWQINGVPCVHAAGVIFLNLRGDFSLVDKYFHTEKYKQSYEPPIIPFPLPGCGDVEGGICPPQHHQRRGRPSTKRILSVGEKTGKRIRCGNCKLLGHHNKKSCTNPAA